LPDCPNPIRGWPVGVTLIEMLTVLVIIGLMLGIGIPAVTNLMKSGA